jgi:hypothetical protein
MLHRDGASFVAMALRTDSWALLEEDQASMIASTHFFADGDALLGSIGRPSKDVCSFIFKPEAAGRASTSGFQQWDTASRRSLALADNSVAAVAKLFAVARRRVYQRRANPPAKDAQSLLALPVKAFQFLCHIFLDNSPDGRRQLGRQKHSLDCAARKSGAFMFCIEGSPRGASRKTQHLGLRAHRVITSSDQGRLERFDLARLPCQCREMFWSWPPPFIAPPAFWRRTVLYSREPSSQIMQKCFHSCPYSSGVIQTWQCPARVDPRIEIPSPDGLTLMGPIIPIICSVSKRCV